jgi:hypothetical protein
MITLRKAAQEYLTLRRSLGFKLRDAGKLLLAFVKFMEQQRAPYITSQLALTWAQQPSTVQPANWARRLSIVRTFARGRSTHPDSGARSVAFSTKTGATLSVLACRDSRSPERRAQDAMPL